MSSDQNGDGPLFGADRNLPNCDVPSTPSSATKDFPHSNCSTGDTSFTSALDLSSSTEVVQCIDRTSRQYVLQTPQQSTTPAPVWSGDQPSEVSSTQPSYLWDDNDLSSFLIKRVDPCVAVHSSFVHFSSPTTEIAPIFHSTVTTVGDALIESAHTEPVLLSSTNAHQSSQLSSLNLAVVDKTESLINSLPSTASISMQSLSHSELSRSSAYLPPESVTVSNHLPTVALTTLDEISERVEDFSSLVAAEALVRKETRDIDHSLPTSFLPQIEKGERLITNSSAHLGARTHERSVLSSFSNLRTVSGSDVIACTTLRPSHVLDEQWSIPRYSNELVASSPIYGANMCPSDSVTSVVTIGSSESAFKKPSISADLTNLASSSQNHSLQENGICCNGTQPDCTLTNGITNGDTAFHSVISSSGDQPPSLSLGADAELEDTTCTRVTSGHSSTGIPKLPTNMSRFSPAQVVAFTGGPPEHILRQLEYENVPAFVAPQRSPPPTCQRSPRVATRIYPPTTEPLSSTSTEMPPAIDIQVQVNARLAPTTPEAVEASSKIIFGNFLTETYQLEVTASAKATVNGGTTSATAVTSINIENSGPAECGASASAEAASGSRDAIPLSEEFASIPRAEPDSMEARVARNLARLGDEINRQYGHRLDSMIKILPADECPIETFSNVARILFSQGPTNWGQVVALFCFGYRLVMRRVRSGLLAAFYQVCKSLLTFCSQMNVFAWIAAQGGWRIVQFLTMRSRSGRSRETPDETSVLPDSGPRDSLLRAWSIRDEFPLDIHRRSAAVWLVGVISIVTALYVYRRSCR